MKQTSKIKRSTLSDAQLKSEIIRLLNSGKTGKTDLYGLIRIKYLLGRERYFKMYDVVYKEWASLKEKGDSEATIQSAVQGQQMGLKSKTERMLILQKMVEDSQADLLLICNSESRIYVRKAIKDIQAEISKMEGDYAPTKIATTNKDGEDVTPIFGMIIK